MRKLSVLAITTAIGVAGSTVLPAQAADTGTGSQKVAPGYGVTIIQGDDLNSLKDKLNGLGGNIGGIYWQVCPPDFAPPGENTPDLPDTDTPDADQPDIPDSNLPDNNLPDTDQPGTDTPDMNLPDTDQPGTDNEVPGGGTGQPDQDIDGPGEDADKPGGDINHPEGDDNQPKTDSQDRTFIQQVADLVNAERVKAGLTPLAIDSKIEAAALVRAKETETSFSHTRPDGSSFSTALTEQGVSFQGSGENIAWGQRTPQEVMTGWMNSDGHRANILNPKFTKIGVGYYQNAAGRNYWTQLFTY
ncbi:CAP domain-containing protein [Clostridium sp. AF19-22AC]|jgi:uncharacterized protein YkwD|uniref:CAP domain-containing protein n=1 Tax=Clostridia TaxID=186801 RepID=UPI000E46FCCC|nr:MULTISPECIES: CAP domain-containing protein [Clostridia]RHR32596.1 CAP domain-containing protein [Clostridium sp. AF19-22AC]